MPIRVRCRCGQKLKAPDAFAGRRVRCPVCKAEVPIPVPSAEPDAPAPPIPSTPIPPDPAPAPVAGPDPAPHPIPGVAEGPAPALGDRPGGPPPEPTSPEPTSPGPDRGAPEGPPTAIPGGTPPVDAGEDEADLPPPAPAPSGASWEPEPAEPFLWEWPDELPEPPRSAAEAPDPPPSPEDQTEPDDLPAAGAGRFEDASPGHPAPEQEPRPDPDRSGSEPEPWSDFEASFPPWGDDEGSGPMPWEPARSDEDIEVGGLGDRLAEGPTEGEDPGPGPGDPDRTERAVAPPGPGLPPTEASRSAALGPELPPTEEGRPALPDPDLSETQASRPALPSPGPWSAPTEEHRPAFRPSGRRPEPEPTEEAWPAFPAPERSSAGGPGPGPGPSGPTPEPELSTIAEDAPGGPPPIDPERPTLGELFPEPGSGEVPEAGSSLMEPFLPSTYDDGPPLSPSQSVPWETRPPGGAVEVGPVESPPVPVDLMDSTSWGHDAHLPGPSEEHPAAATPQQIAKEQLAIKAPPPASPGAPARPVRPALVRQADPGAGRRRGRRLLVGVVLGLSAVLLGSAVVLGLLRLREGLPRFLAEGRAPRPIPPSSAGPDRDPARAPAVDPSPAVALLPGPGPEPAPARFDGPPRPGPGPEAGLLGPNLVHNPGFEEWTPRDGPPEGLAEFLGWERLGSVAVRAFEGGPVDVVAPLDPPDLGRSYALGGLPEPRSASRTMLRQAVDLSPMASRIDAGAVRFDASAWLGGVDQTGSLSPNDSATLTLRFLDGSLDELPGTSVPIGPIDDGLLQAPSARPGVPRMAFRSRSGPVPAGTRALSVELAFDRNAGEVIDATADGLRVVLEADP